MNVCLWSFTKFSASLMWILKHWQWMRLWFAPASSSLWFKNPKQWPCKWTFPHIAGGWAAWLLYAVMHTAQRKTHYTADLWRAIHPQLAESKPRSTVSVLVSALRSHGEASDGVAFVPLHGVSNVDGGEVDVGLFLERTHMTRQLECLGRFHGSSLGPCTKFAPPADCSME